MANGEASRLNLVHVVEPIAAAYSMDIYAANVSELQQEAIKFAEERLAALGDEWGLVSGQHTFSTRRTGTGDPRACRRN